MSTIIRLTKFHELNVCKLCSGLCRFGDSNYRSPSSQSAPSFAFSLRYPFASCQSMASDPTLTSTSPCMYPRSQFLCQYTDYFSYLYHQFCIWYVVKVFRKFEDRVLKRVLKRVPRHACRVWRCCVFRHNACGVPSSPGSVYNCSPGDRYSSLALSRLR